MISLLFLALAAICNSVMDTISFRYNISIFRNLNVKFWNPLYSWENKWKNGDPDQGERFFGSSTFLVFLTDAWHLFKSLSILFVALAIVYYNKITNYTLLDVLIYHTLFGSIFEVFFGHLWRIKNES